jgi:hypothetical protein
VILKIESIAVAIRDSYPILTPTVLNEIKPLITFKAKQRSFKFQRELLNSHSLQLVTFRMASSGILRRVALVRTDVSEEFSASIIRVTRIGELRKTLALVCVGC